MKYGVVCTCATSNIGDDIQSLAAIDLLRKNGISEYICVEREALKHYSGEPIALIMNGWFLHNPNNFPPSDKIKPLFISFHCEHEEVIKEHRKYFQKHEPIGCRSNSTVSMCEKYGIKAYLSGCITLCFDEAPEKEEYVCATDIRFDDLIERKNLIYLTHIKEDLITQSNQKRLQRAETLLDLYRGAKLVITSRLHCILPCRAFNTNAKFVHSLYDVDPRFKGLEDIINGQKLENINFNDVPSTVDRKIITQNKNNLRSAFKELLNQS